MTILLQPTNHCTVGDPTLSELCLCGLLFFVATLRLSVVRGIVMILILITIVTRALRSLDIHAIVGFLFLFREGCP